MADETLKSIIETLDLVLATPVVLEEATRDERKLI